MTAKYFLNTSWAIQLAVGICLFTVSFLIEKRVLEAFITTSTLALLLAASLELGKAVAIIWHRYMSYQTVTDYPFSVRFASNTFRMGLVGLSMICSLLFLSNNLDRPNLDIVKTAETSRNETRLNVKLERIENQKQQRLTLIKKNQNEAYQRIKKGFDLRLSILERQRKTERDNVVNGTYKGPRYAEILTRQKQLRRLADKTLKKMLARHKQAYFTEQRLILKESLNKREKAFEQSDNNQDKIQISDFANDERANDTRIVSFLKVVESVFNIHVLPLQFVFIFSLLISMLMEIGILLAFNTITLSILPALKASHDADLSRELLYTEIKKESKEDEIRHKEAINKIRNTADNVMDKANEYMNVHGIKD